jgi:hypothetical protein
MHLRQVPQLQLKITVTTVAVAVVDAVVKETAVADVLSAKLLPSL